MTNQLLTINPTVKDESLNLLIIAADFINYLKPQTIVVEYSVDVVKNSLKANGGVILQDNKAMIDALLSTYFDIVEIQNKCECDQISQWTSFSLDLQKTTDFKSVKSKFEAIDQHLQIRSFLVGYDVTIADVCLWGVLKGIPSWNKNIKSGKDVGVNALRWYNHINSLAFVVASLSNLAEQIQKLSIKKKDEANYEIGLEGAEMGKVVTRFPPEPSGYLHIGHAKAALLNQYFARKYQGRFIIRFDDTNPTKENIEFENSILEDLDLLGIHSSDSKITYTSNYFDKCEELAIKMIHEGKAYVDDTDQETMREERNKGAASKCRENSIEENLRRFQEMKKASEEGLKNCLRAKISPDHPNGCMRDPVLYRCNLTPHHRTGSTYKIYPTYDFACPIVDSIEGVTHTLRTNEYHDRIEQYYWIIDALGIRKPFIWEFSRLNFVYTLLSKRKLNWFVNNKLVTGWDDPRFPTVRGILRRGLTVDALKKYILMQGPSTSTVSLEWDKLWAVNKQVIDLVAPRHTAIHIKDVCLVKVIEGGSLFKLPSTKEIPKHKKNPDVGLKSISYSSTLYFDAADASQLELDEEITLMDWGNAFVRKINRNSDGIVSDIEIQLNLEGDFKKTKKKLTWLSQGSTIDITLTDYDYLITKKKLEETDKLEDFVNATTEFYTEAMGDANLKHVKVGDIVQLERRGFYICDSANDDKIKLILIPDGKAKSIASKAADPKK